MRKPTGLATLLCERVEHDTQTGMLSAIRIMGELWAERTPFFWTVCVLSHVSGIVGPTRVRCEVLKPDLSLLAQSEAETSLNDDVLAFASLAFVFENIPFEAYGTYTFNLSVAGELVGSRALPFRSRATPPKSPKVL